METAGKQVDDEELRDLMKDNGIGRPSTRAAIIETLFRRNYIRRERKNVVPTVTGMELIRVINNELLKSAEMTGKWEFKLRQIEKGAYQAEAFLQEMKEMVGGLVMQVKNELAPRILIAPDHKKEETPECPKCKKGNLLKGKTAMGCSEYKNGCTFKIPFDVMGKKLTETQLTSLIKKKKTTNIKGLETPSGKKDGILELNALWEIVFKEMNTIPKELKEAKETSPAVCPKCKSGAILKGGTAYGCSAWKAGCNFRLPFEFMGKLLTEAHILALAKKGETPLIKGLMKNGEKVNARLRLNSSMELSVTP
jgi:DNA topoisomerase-3